MQTHELFEFLEYCWRDGSHVSLTYLGTPINPLFYRALRHEHRKAGSPENVQLYMPVKGHYSLRDFFRGPLAKFSRWALDEPIINAGWDNESRQVRIL